MKRNWMIDGMVAAALLLAVQQAGATGKITSVLPTAEGLTVTIETELGEEYQLQCRPSLVSGEWINEGVPFVADAASRTHVIATVEQQCYFRVIPVVKVPDTLPPPLPPLPKPLPPRLPPPPPTRGAGEAPAEGDTSSGGLANCTSLSVQLLEAGSAAHAVAGLAGCSRYRVADDAGGVGFGVWRGGLQLAPLAA